MQQPEISIHPLIGRLRYFLVLQGVRDALDDAAKVTLR